MNSFSDILAAAKTKATRRLSVAAADDPSVLKAIKSGMSEGLIIPILVGNKKNILEIADKINFDISAIEIIDESDPLTIASIAVSLINQGKADILMKGLIGTAPLLKAVVDKEHGLRTQRLLSHFALFESKYYHKLFAVTDVAMNIAPDLKEKILILRNAVEAMHKLGNNIPKVALITPVEIVNSKIESTVHASVITQMNKQNEITGCIVDGPLALDNAISTEASKHKGIISEVAGDADILVVPDLDSGNILYKSLLFLGGAHSAGYSELKET